MSKLVETVSKKPLPPHTRQITFDVCVNDRDGEDVEVPYVLIKLA